MMIVRQSSIPPDHQIHFLPPSSTITASARLAETETDINFTCSRREDSFCENIINFLKSRKIK